MEPVLENWYLDGEYIVGNVIRWPGRCLPTGKRVSFKYSAITTDAVSLYNGVTILLGKKYEDLC